ncbi:MAG: hypothetical protein KAR12_06090 [Methylococcales bacterium]|nr:hypothetical protein [Methylococcales bacterium]
MVSKPLSLYLAFPPIPSPNQSLPFSWITFLSIAILVVICVTPFVVRIILSNIRFEIKRQIDHGFPLWGWLGVVIILIFWIIAWNRFSLFESFQKFTFTPLWVGYILVINALTFRRSGRCSLLDRTSYFLFLFPVSAIFWWGFEYINRFVENWYYVGISEFGSWSYFFFATLPFATVLPAVLSTTEWLSTFPRLSAGLDRFLGLTITVPRMWSWSLIIVSVTGLIALAVWPGQLFCLVWIVPLTLICGLQLLTEKPPLINDITAGDWRRLWRLALAGLVCGIFWEMWNAHSLAHWKYSVPYVQRFKIFEMPLIGYAGYLPFGVICGLFADFIITPENVVRKAKEREFYKGKSGDRSAS